VIGAVLEMDDGYLFVTAVSRDATLAVHTDRRCDIGMVGYEMTVLASRVGPTLTPAARPDVGGLTQ
jgi:predicted regulator of Ras-like GTPase activity (Roadblock/LC7/MglB family)